MQKQQQLFAEMQSVRKMLLLQDPHLWHTEPYFWAHGAHLVPSAERKSYQLSWAQRASAPSSPLLAEIIGVQVALAMQGQPHQQLQQQQQQQQQQQEEQQVHAHGVEKRGRHKQRQRHQQAMEAALSLEGRSAWQVPMEMVSCSH